MAAVHLTRCRMALAYSRLWRAIRITHSGASKVIMKYRTRRQNMRNGLSLSAGRLGWMALQVQRKIVAVQLQTRPIVPRSKGSGAHLKILVSVAFIMTWKDVTLPEQP
jgi:hypothetical protein